MSIRCSNGHEHDTVDDVKRCYGILPSATPAPSVAATPTPDRHEWRVGGVTPRQLDYILDLGGDPILCRTYTREEAHKVIDNLLVAKGRKARMSGTHTWSPTYKPEPEPEPEPERPSRSTTETKVVLPLLDMLPDGYYAWTPALDAEVTFLRVKRWAPTAKNRWAGATLIQTQHSDELLPAWVRWPSGRISRYRNGRDGLDIETVINGLIVDHRRAAQLYAKLKGNCCICNKQLTDPRSRHYGIGPDCEKTHQSFIAAVDDENDGRSWEQLAHEKVS